MTIRDLEAYLENFSPDTEIAHITYDAKRNYPALLNISPKDGEDLPIICAGSDLQSLDDAMIKTLSESEKEIHTIFEDSLTPIAGYHSESCMRNRPDCPCTKCINDGTRGCFAHDKPCGVTECPDFAPDPAVTQ
jgi:hypothetical protein